MLETLTTTEEEQAKSVGGDAPRIVELEGADAPCTAELADCTCPDFCERDHDNE